MWGAFFIHVSSHNSRVNGHKTQRHNGHNEKTSLKETVSFHSLAHCRSTCHAMLTVVGTCRSTCMHPSARCEERACDRSLLAFVSRLRFFCVLAFFARVQPYDVSWYIYEMSNDTHTASTSVPTSCKYYSCMLTLCLQSQQQVPTRCSLHAGSEP